MALPICLGVLMALLPPPINGCTIIAVGKEATADGTALLTHTDDAGLGDTSDYRLVRVPAMNHAKGTKRPVYAFQGGYPRVVTNRRGPYYAPKEGQTVFEPLEYIPQVRHTYAYYDQNYGLVNEMGLSVAESTAAAKTVGWPKSLPYGHCAFDIAELSKVALERCATARCAIQTMGDLATEYGFYSNFNGEPSRPYYDDSAEILGVADHLGEVWIFHVMTGPNNASAVWAAQRVPDDSILAAPNTFVIREIDFDDKLNFMYSDNVQTFAHKQGWWDPSEGPFDFTKAYTDPKPIPFVPLYDGRRMWRIYTLVAPSLDLDPSLGYLIRPNRTTYPFAVRPDNKLTAKDMMDILRDHYEGTPFDLTKGIAAGPFGNPVRFDGSYNIYGSWERPISVQRAVYSFVMQVRPELPPYLATVMWYGYDSPHGTVYVPFWCGQETVPEPYLLGKQSEFHPRSAYWAFNFVDNWSYNMYSHVHQDVAQEQRRLEDAGFAFQQKMDTSVQSLHKADALRHIEKHQTEWADSVVSQWWALAWRLVSKYNKGYIITGEKPGQMGMPGYPEWWLKMTKFDQWPGNTFLYPSSSARPANRQLARTEAAQGNKGTLRTILSNCAYVLLGASGACALMNLNGRRRHYEPLP